MLKSQKEAGAASSILTYTPGLSAGGGGRTQAGWTDLSAQSLREGRVPAPATREQQRRELDPGGGWGHGQSRGHLVRNSSRLQGRTGREQREPSEEVKEKSVSSYGEQRKADILLESTSPHVPPTPPPSPPSGEPGAGPLPGLDAQAQSPGFRGPK